MKRLFLPIPGLWLLATTGVCAQPEAPPEKPSARFALESASPVLRRWINQPPDLLEDIENGQAFPTRLGIGIALVSSRGNEAEYQVSLQDVVLANTRVSLSSDFSYRGGANQQWGADARYYLAPLGSYINFAPQVGYRSLLIDGNYRAGTELGGKLLFALAPRAADIAVSQSWILAGMGEELGRTVLEFGYSLSPTLRINAAIELINSSLRKDTSFGLRLELISF